VLQRLSAKPGVLALRIGGHVSRAEIDECYDLLQLEWESHPKLDLYIEIENLAGFDTEALVGDFRYGMGLLKQLDRFGKVAIVSSQSWILWASRLESALLPGISYRTYRPAEREQALAWVQGTDELPYGQAIWILPTTREDTLGIVIDGRLTDEEMARVVHELDERRQVGPVRRILVRMHSLGTIDPRIMANSGYLGMKLRMLHDLERYALVGAPGWMTALVDTMKPLLRLEIRQFDPENEPAAWDWLEAQPIRDQNKAA